MQDGGAEVFGTEMVKGKEYQFGPGTKLAIFTYVGCVIVIKGLFFFYEDTLDLLSLTADCSTILFCIVGKTEFAYVAKETPMIMYLNAHAALETMRRYHYFPGKPVYVI